MKLSWSAFLVVLCVAACHGDDAPGQSGDAGSTTPDGGWPPDPDPSTGVKFRFGVNGGYFTPKVDDAATAALARAVGVDTMRLKLTEQHLTTWGDTIEQGDMMKYAMLGMSDHVCFLGGPIADHSQAPSSAQDWEREQWAPKNLYEPIFLGDGSVNPDNYWARFVERVVTNYHPWIRTYEVWNEPDQVGGNWQATQSWATSPPSPSDLVWWKDSIFAYVRMLRVTYAVVHKLDPTAKVALGGIGYPSFLSAILRYTDEEGSGKVDGEHPATGAAYFDVVSFHYYPVFAPGNSDVGALGIVDAKQKLVDELAKAGVTGKSFIVTESGGPRYAFDGKPGGGEYARNYLVKMMTSAAQARIERVDWFALGDGKAVGGSTDPFDYMGLYLNYANVSSSTEAMVTDTGIAYATLGALLGGATTDPAGTAALALPTGVRGSAFRTTDGKRALVLWAVADAGEAASGSVTIASTVALKVHRWDWSKSKAMEEVSPELGKVTLALSSSPVIVTE